MYHATLSVVKRLATGFARTGGSEAGAAEIGQLLKSRTACFGLISVCAFRSGSLGLADHAFRGATGHERHDVQIVRLHDKLDEQARLAADTIQRANSTKSEESLAKLVKRVASWSGCVRTWNRDYCLLSPPPVHRPDMVVVFSRPPVSRAVLAVCLHCYRM